MGDVEEFQQFMVSGQGIGMVAGQTSIGWPVNGSPKGFFDCWTPGLHAIVRRRGPRLSGLPVWSVGLLRSRI